MRVLKYIVLITVLLGLTLFLIDQWIVHTSQNYLYSEVSTLPKNKVGLLLGTSKYKPQGGINPYYAHRLDAAVTLFNAGKIDYILISGDNSHKSYNEPYTFKKDLVARGIPEERIVLDYAGFRTLDSVIRAKKIFGQNSFTIISQKFHNERAIYLTENLNIHAIAYNAKDVSIRYGLKTTVREYFARAKASIDLLFNIEPKFLGKQIPIG